MHEIIWDEYQIKIILLFILYFIIYSFHVDKT